MYVHMYAYMLTRTCILRYWESNPAPCTCYTTRLYESLLNLGIHTPSPKLLLKV